MFFTKKEDTHVDCWVCGVSTNKRYVTQLAYGTTNKDRKHLEEYLEHLGLHLPEQVHVCQHCLPDTDNVFAVDREDQFYKLTPIKSK